MSLQGKTFLNLLAGGLAGLLAWVLTDPTRWFADIFQPHHRVRLGLFHDWKFLLYGAIFGLLLGLLLAMIDSLTLDSRPQIRRRLIVGSLAGFGGGWLGLALGQIFYAAICKGFVADPDAQNLSPGPFLSLLIGRALGYALIGGFVGAAQGVSSRSSLIARQGAFGGLLGGFLGGMGFEILNGLGFEAMVSRLLALIATGALAGFFVGAVPNLFKQAWIRVVLGRNEGKEYLIAKPVTTIGRSELSDIGLYGDPAIAHTHIAIESLSAQNRHRLRFVGASGPRGVTYAPPLVNGQPVTHEQWLADGDTIQISKRTLLFHEKATRKNDAPFPEAVSGGGQSAEARPYVGEELSGTEEFSPRPSLTTSADVVALMGTAPGAETAVAAGRGTRLVCIQGPYAGQSFLLSHAPTTIGRAADRDISLPADTSVSRTHTRIIYKDGRHIVADDGSSNGTRLNGERLNDPAPLNFGDRLGLGETTLRYE